MKITFKWKFLGGLILFEALVMLLIMGVNLAMTNDGLDQAAELRLDKLNACLTNKLERHKLGIKPEEITSLMYECHTSDSLVYYLVFDDKDRLIRKNNWPGDALADNEALSAVMGHINSVPWETPHFYKTASVVLQENGQINGKILYGGTTLYKQFARNSFIKACLYISVAALLISVGACALLVRMLSRKLKRIEHTANEILSGRYDVTVEPLGSDTLFDGGMMIHVVSSTLNEDIAALKISEKKQKQIAIRMQAIINALPDIMLLCRVSDDYILYANAGVELVTGHASARIVGKSMGNIDLGISHEQYSDWKGKLLSHGALTNHETTIKHKNGNTINVLVSVSSLEIDNVDHALIICRDITDRKLVEAAVAYANRQLNYVLDAASEIAIISTDVKGVIQMFNRGAEKMLGYRAREKIGSPLHFEIHDKNELVQRSKELSRQLNCEVPVSDVLTLIPIKQGAETRNWTYICKNGERLIVSLTVTRVQESSGKIIGFLGIARDITAQLQAEHALHDLNYQLEKRVEERTEELEDTNKNLADAMQNLQLAQVELVRSEKLTALGDIVAVVAHEINTPIGNCLTVATTLRERSAQLYSEVEQGTLRRSSLSSYVDDSKTALDILIRGLNRSSELISNFKQVAVDQTSEQRRVFKLHQVIDEVVALMMAKLRKTPHQLKIDIPEDIVMDSFPGPLEQVVSNLINNAMLHAFDDNRAGTMTLTAAVVDQHVKLEFADNGKGIPAQYLNRIFDPFFTTKLGRGGTGLGLNIVHNIVKNMLGGQIDVICRGPEEATTGTIFTILMPLSAPVGMVHEKRQSEQVV